jgi:hypothetical protein
MSDAMASIAASFGIGAAVGEGAEDGAAAMAGLPRRRAPGPAVFPFALPPALMTTLTVGSFIDLPDTFGPPMGWFWDVTMISLSGFTSGAVAVSKNAPLITAAGAPVAVEPVTYFTQAGVINFPQKGTPLLDGNDRLVFTVTATITGVVQVSGSVIAVPACRMDEYLS